MLTKGGREGMQKGGLILFYEKRKILYEKFLYYKMA
jgi:hypothetical protein